jgi:hypothetical protein
MVSVPIPCTGIVYIFPGNKAACHTLFTCFFQDTRTSCQRHRSRFFLFGGQMLDPTSTALPADIGMHFGRSQSLETALGWRQELGLHSLHAWDAGRRPRRVRIPNTQTLRRVANLMWRSAFPVYLAGSTWYTKVQVSATKYRNSTSRRPTSSASVHATTSVKDPTLKSRNSRPPGRLLPHWKVWDEAHNQMIN